MVPVERHDIQDGAFQFQWEPKAFVWHLCLLTDMSLIMRKRQERESKIKLRKT